MDNFKDKLADPKVQKIAAMPPPQNLPTKVNPQILLNLNRVHKQLEVKVYEDAPKGSGRKSLDVNMNGTPKTFYVNEQELEIARQAAQSLIVLQPVLDEAPKAIHEVDPRFDATGKSAKVNSKLESCETGDCAKEECGTTECTDQAATTDTPQEETKQ